MAGVEKGQVIYKFLTHACYPCVVFCFVHINGQGKRAGSGWLLARSCRSFFQPLNGSVSVPSYRRLPKRGPLLCLPRGWNHGRRYGKGCGKGFARFGKSGWKLCTFVENRLKKTKASHFSCGKSSGKCGKSNGRLHMPVVFYVENRPLIPTAPLLPGPRIGRLPCSDRRAPVPGFPLGSPSVRRQGCR